MPEANDRVAIVTGSNTGIGKATAAGLAERGYHVVLACRSEAKTRPVIDEIKAATGNDHIDFLALDLADLARVADSAREYLASGRRLDVLVNNAGLAGQRGLTADGFELAFGVNHLGHFLFTTLLLDRIVQSAPARIVNVSSSNHYRAKGIDWEAVRRPTKTFVGLHEYDVSKLANVLFTQQLAQRLDSTKVTAYALNPGAVASDVWRRMPKPVYALFQAVRRMKPIEEGARPSIYCATEPGIEEHNGGYVDEDCSFRPASERATDELGQQLWRRSENWTKEWTTPSR
jgi:NAD(P)-dependent dehydrogenase (short-subunit alcohol dehydrogenase family)